jgi:hypothetical protein
MDEMVMRSLHMPRELEDRLKSLAFQLGCPKADLMRHFVERGLASLVARHGAEWDADEHRWRLAERGAEMIRDEMRGAPIAPVNRQVGDAMAADLARLSAAG